MVTERQLRAEAVERLIKNKPHTYMSLLKHALADSRYDGMPDTDALIDLLTDDEPHGGSSKVLAGSSSHGGDAVEIMRKAAKGFVGGTGEVMENAKALLGVNPKSGLDSVVFKTLADMVERDYVRRADELEALVDGK